MSNKNQTDMRWLNTHGEGIKIEVYEATFFGSNLPLEPTVKSTKCTRMHILGSHSIHSADQQYFEVKLLGKSPKVGIGLTRKTIGLSSNLFVGNAEELYFYNGKSGNILHKGVSSNSKVTMNRHDIMGCGVDQDGYIFFTVNGWKFGSTFKKENEELYPLLSFWSMTEVSTNFGQKPFTFEAMNRPKKSNNKLKRKRLAEEMEIQANSSEEGFLNHLKDITFVAQGGEAIQSHRVFLSMRSSVFQTMLKPDERQKTLTMVEIEDFQASTIRQMVKFIETDSVDEKDVDFHLLAIAHKYKVDSLQALCEDVLSKQLTTNNVIDAWNSIEQLIGIASSKAMMEACQKLIKSKWEEVKQTELFSAMLKDDGHKLFKMIASANAIDDSKNSMVNDLLSYMQSYP